MSTESKFGPLRCLTGVVRLDEGEPFHTDRCTLTRVQELEFPPEA